MTNVLVVDDEASVRRVLGRILTREGYACEDASSAASARTALATHEFDLVLSDVNMPGESGLSLAQHIAAGVDPPAVVMVTAVDDAALARSALELGAYGYIIKPFEPNEIVISVVNALHRRDLEREKRGERARLEDLVAARTRELRRSQEETINRLSLAAEIRDKTTGLHLQRMSRYSALLSQLLGTDDEGCELVRLASLMHDVGKIGIPDAILCKPGALDEEEMEVIRTHSEIGYRILGGSDSQLLELGAMMALTHHERFDGGGYPRRLRGQDIPIEGRMLAVADVFDALTSERPYKSAYPAARAFELIVAERGKHFDPELVDLFTGAEADVLAIQALFAA